MNVYAWTDTAAACSATMRRLPTTLQARWLRLPSTDRRVIVTSAVVAVGLLIALAQTCHESVLKGERLRAGQRQMATAPSPALIHSAAAAATRATGL